MVVCGVTAEDEYYLEKHQYTVDLGGLDFAVANSYTITYTYKKDTSIKATLTINVVRADTSNLSLSGSSSRSA